MARGWEPTSSHAFMQSYDSEHPRRQRSDDAAGLFRLAERSEDARHHRRHQSVTRGRRPGRPITWCTGTMSLTSSRRAHGPGRHLQHLLLLAGRSAHPGRNRRPVPPGRSQADVRTDARLRQPFGTLLRGNVDVRRGARELPAGLHSPGPDQCGLQPRSHPGRPRLTVAHPGTVRRPAVSEGRTRSQRRAPGRWGWPKWRWQRWWELGPNRRACQPPMPGSIRRAE